MTLLVEVGATGLRWARLEGGAPGNPHGYHYVERMHPRSVAKINDIFARDFELFGYERQTS